MSNTTLHHQFIVSTWLLVFVFLVTSANAGIYVVQPSAGSTCRGGEECTLQWLDDGQSPLLTAIGTCTVGLFTGEQKLVQSLGDIDVSGQHSFTFTVNPKAGPNSGSYYISLVSKSLKINGTSATAWSPFFKLTNMDGSFASPLPSTSIVSSVTQPSTSNTILSTITIGTLSTSLLPLPTTSTSPSSSGSSLSASPSSPSSSHFVSSTATPTSPNTSTASSSTPIPSAASAPNQAGTTLVVPVSFATSTDVVEQTSSGFVTSTLPPGSPTPNPNASSANSLSNGSIKLTAGVPSLSLFLMIACTLSLLASFM